MRRAEHDPQRRCVGCGRSASKRELLRFVAADGLAVADPSCRRGGRGAYLCRASSATVDQACLERAARRNALARALRGKVRLDPDLFAADPLTRAASPDTLRPGTGGAGQIQDRTLESIG